MVQFFFILFILGYIIPSRIILNEYLKSENRYVENNIERFNSLFNQDIENLDKILSDWAYWDDTYNFIQTKNKYYIESNLVDETFENLRINYMIFLDKNLNLVYKKYYNLITSKEEDFPENLLEIINKNIKNYNVENIENFKGILSINSEVIVFSVKTITTSDLKSPFNGYISMGYLLTPDRIWNISKLLGYPITLFSYNYKYLPKDYIIAKEKLGGTNIYINPVDNYKINAYFTLKDIFNNNCAILRVDFPRDIYSQGRMTLNYFLIIFLIIGLTLTSVFIIILRKMVIDPLTNTIKKMKIIADKLDFNERLEVKGKDEIADFSESFNKIIESFKEYEEKLKESEEKYRSLFENAVEGIFQSTPDGRIINANKSFIRMLGYDSFEELQKLDVKKDLYYNPDDRDLFLEEIHKKGIFNNIELVLKKKDGSKIIVLENSRAVKDKNGKVLFYEGMFTDITEIKRYEEKLSFRIKLERLINEIALDLISVESENIKDMIIKNFEKLGKILFFDRIYTLILSNNRKKIEEIYEWDKDNYEKISNKVLNSYINTDIRYENIIEVNKDSTHPLFDYPINYLILIPLIYGSTLRGFIGFENVTNKEIEYDDFIKLFLRIFGDIIINSIERVKNEDNLKYISFHDSLTGLYNRFYFEEEMERLSKSRDLSLSIILCDIDNLKYINDSFGHDTGDIAIVEVAKILKGIFRESDIIARIGGDEFVILLQNIDEDTIKNMIDRIYEELNIYSSKVGTFPINISIGYSILDRKEKDPLILFKEADDMMYNMKLTKKGSDKEIIIDKLKRDLILKGYIDSSLIEKMKNIAEKFSTYIKLSEKKKENLLNLIEYHDIGICKTFGSYEAINKKEDFYDNKIHTHTGYRIAINSKKLSKIADLILKHHEEWNGNGFPLNLKNDEIPVECRVFSIIYDYCKNKNLDEIKINKGKKFDPVLVDQFINFIEENKKITYFC
ncbi:MAG: diguanylate cyclase domain-containing protein [Caldisericia bacterium]